MIALADVKAALAAMLATIPHVDIVNTYGYFPNVLTAGIAAIMPPFRLESRYGFTQRSDGEPDWQSHRFTVEFWVRNTGDPQALDASISALNHDAVATLLSNQLFAVGGGTMRLGFFDGNFDYTLTFEVDDFFTRPAQDGPTYLVATMTIPATDVLFAPAGGIAARNVQGAIEELDAEKLGLTGGSMTGPLILSTHPTDDLGAATKWYVDHLDRLLVPDAAGVPVARLLPDFVRIGHPLQPGLTWTPGQGLQIPASTIVGSVVEYVWTIETFFGSPGPIGAVFYTDVDIRVSKIAVFIRDNNIEETANFLIQSAATATGFVAVDASVIGRVALTPDDLSIVVVPNEEVYDGATGQSVTSGVNFVVTGEDPLIPAGSWIGLREGNNGTLMGNVTVTLLARYA